MEVKNLWAPWRSQYVGGEREEGCVFCLAAAEPDNPERLVVAQDELTVTLLNRFPYATGHLMVTPRNHTGLLEDLSAGEVASMWAGLLKAKAALTKLYNPSGFNVGFNLGKSAGAGIIDHLHLHLVPRWDGDTNFMAVFADVRVIPHHLEQVRLDMLKALKA